MNRFPLQRGRPLQVSSPLDPDTFFPVEFSGRDALSELFSYTVEVIAPPLTPLPFDALLGHPVSVRLLLPKGDKRFFHGLCVGMSQEGSTRDYTTYRLELAPQAWLLTRNSQSRIFQQIAIPGILEAVFAGLDVKFELSKNYLPRDYCVQYREADFAFASRLMEEEGIYYYFRHTEKGHVMIVADSPSSHSAVPGANPITYRPDAPAETQDEDFVRLLSKSQRITPARVTLRDHTFELPHQALEAVGRLNDTVAVGKVSHKLHVRNAERLEVYDWPGAYAQRFDGINPSGGDRGADLRNIQPDGERTARIRAEQRASEAIAIEGEGECRQMSGGYKFRLAAVATDPSGMALRPDGEYVLASVRHECTQIAPFVQSGPEGFTYRNRFTCIPIGLPFRPPLSTPRPQIAGTQTAVVTGPTGEEIFVDKYGRVKVQFHWDRQGKHDAESSCWVRVSQIHAGGGWGAISSPRIGEEVVVSFEEGDPDRPLVVGRVYNPRAMPPFSLPGSKKISGMKSNTTPGGGGNNEISLDDTKGKELMNINAQYDQRVNTNHNRNTTIGNDSTEQVGNDVSESVGNNQTETVTNNLTTNVGNKILISAGTSITLQCGASMIHMNQAGFITISGTVITVAAAANLAMTAPLTEVVGGVMLSAVGGVTLVEGGVTHVGGAKLVSVTSGGQIDLLASGNLNAKAAIINLNG